MTRTLPFIALALLLTVALPAPAAAQGDVTCPGTSYDDNNPRTPPSPEIDGDWRIYLSINNAVGDPRANLAGQIRLRGWLYVPPGAPPDGGWPILIFNHGSGQDADPRCELAEWFVPRGYVMFMPQRRGHEGSTGIYFEDYATQQVLAACVFGGCTDQEERLLRRRVTFEYLRDQGDDVTAAINYVRNNVRGVNPGNVAVIGHSFGAITSLLWNMRDGPNTKVVVSISAAAQSWGPNGPNNPDDPIDYLEIVLKDAVQHAKRPIYFLAPINDKNTLPMAELPYVAANRPMRFQATIFGKVPEELLTDCPRTDSDGKEVTCLDVAHGKFVREPSQVKRWAPSVTEFLRRFGVK